MSGLSVRDSVNPSLAPGLAALDFLARAASLKKNLIARSDRHRVDCEAWLVDEAGQTILKCQPVDLSESGVYVILDVGTPITSGERYELHVAKAGVLDDFPYRFEENRRPATVVRVELLVGHAEERLGVALRFQQPLQLNPADTE